MQFVLPRVSEPEYAAVRKGGARHRGTYNSYALFVAALWLLWSAGLCPLWLVLVQSVSLAVTLLLDLSGPDTRPVSPADLPDQLRAYVALVLGVGSDLWALWLGSLVLFAVFHRVIDRVTALPFSFSLGTTLFIFYAVVRTLFLVAALATRLLPLPPLAPDVSVRQVHRCPGVLDGCLTRVCVGAAICCGATRSATWD